MKARIRLLLCFALPAAAPSLSAQAASPAGAILGTWHGSSICVDPARDTACHNEEVIYQVDSAAGPSGPVRMSADKIVNGSRMPMGDFRLFYDSVRHTWSADLQTRLPVRWSFAPSGTQMSATLVEMPSGRVIRRVTARR